MFRSPLVHPDGEPRELAVLVTAVPNWDVGETILLGGSQRWRILGIQTEISEELIEHG